MRRFIVVGLVAVGLSGCFDTDQTSEGLAKALSAIGAMDAANNSPDVTVKSWWRLRDASLSVRIETCNNDLNLAAAYFEKLSKLSSNDRYNSSNCAFKVPAFDRQITKVEVQSDTRAIVTAQIRNISPPEEGATLTVEDKKVKDAGVPFQYLLEREDVKNGWQITKISSFSSYTKDWQDIYPKPEPSNNRYVYDFAQ